MLTPVQASDEDVPESFGVAVNPELTKDPTTPSTQGARIMYKLWYPLKSKALAAFVAEQCTGIELIANLYVAAWFLINILITLSSKATFKNFKFPYPIMLTAAHLSVTGIGSQIASFSGWYESIHVSRDTVKKLVWFSLVFTINIWLSNYGLLVVSVPVHQVARTTIPLFTMILSLLFWRETYPWRMLPSVLLVIVGVAATVVGDVEMTVYGAIVVAAGCAFSSLKGIMTQKAQLGNRGLHAFDLLRVVCPMAVAELLILGMLNGEVLALVREMDKLPWGTSLNLLVQGLLAFLLNFVSFKCVALRSPLTMNIAGNVKQIVTPLLSVLFIGGRITTMLLIGLVVTFVGAVWYGAEARAHKQQKEQNSPQSDKD